MEGVFTIRGHSKLSLPRDIFQLWLLYQKSYLLLPFLSQFYRNDFSLTQAFFLQSRLNLQPPLQIGSNRASLETQLQRRLLCSAVSINALIFRGGSIPSHESPLKNRSCTVKFEYFKRLLMKNDPNQSCISRRVILQLTSFSFEIIYATETMFEFLTFKIKNF